MNAVIAESNVSTVKTWSTRSIGHMCTSSSAIGALAVKLCNSLKVHAANNRRIFIKSDLLTHDVIIRDNVKCLMRNYYDHLTRNKKPK